MRIIVTDDKEEWFCYDTAKDSECLCPGDHEITAVIAALEEAVVFLRPEFNLGIRATTAH